MRAEPVAQFRRTAMEGGYIGPTRFEGSLPATDGELRIDVDLGEGQHRLLTRQIHVQDGGTVTVGLERDLR